MPVELNRGTKRACRWIFRSNYDRAIQGLLGIGIASQMQITIGDLCKNISVLRVKFDSALNVLGGFIPAALASIDIAGEQEGQRIVRQTLLCQLQFRQGAVVIEITPIKMFGASEMGFA